MKTFFIVIAVIAAVVLIVVFRKQIGAFFSPGPKEGSSCTDTSGNAGTIVNGACIKNAPKDGDACMISGKPGVIQNGSCVAIESAERVAQIIPARISVRRLTRNCMSRIQVPQYPGVTWTLVSSNRFFCYYTR